MCGDSYRSRGRDLALVTLPAGTTRARLYEIGGSATDLGAESELQERFQHLWRQSKREEAVRTQELVAAFAAGSLVIVMALVVLPRLWRKPEGADYAAAPLHERQMHLVSESEDERQPQVARLEIE
jgi:hypothetical protein